MSASQQEEEQQQCQRHRKKKSTYNLMPWGYGSKLGAGRSSNVAESLQDGGFDFLQLLARVAILHVGNCNAEAVGVVVQVKLL